MATNGSFVMTAVPTVTTVSLANANTAASNIIKLCFDVHPHLADTAINFLTILEGGIRAATDPKTSGWATAYTPPSIQAVLY